MCAGILYALASRCAAVESTPAVSIDSLKLAHQVYALRANIAIGNPAMLVVVQGTDAMLVDAGIPENGPALKTWLEGQGVRNVRYIATTHYHTDHVWGMESFAFDKPIVISTQQQRDRLKNGGTALEGVGIDVRVLPQLLVGTRLGIAFGGQNLELLRPPHRAGHTDGDLIVVVRPANVLFVGDYLFAGRFPVIDVAAGGSLWGYLANLDWMLQLSDDLTRWVAGHGAFEPDAWSTYDRAHVSRWLATLRSSIDFVSKRRLAGDSIEQVQAEGLGEFFVPFHQKPRYVSESAWIEVVYRALDACWTFHETRKS